MTDQDSSFTGGIVETIKTIVYALLIAGIFRTLFFQPFWIPSSSMKDTLLIGDFLFVNKMAYGYSSYSCVIPVVQVSVCPFIGERWMGGEPERGDVVVFAHPVTKQDFIKRVVGLPGDTVQMVDGRLVINLRHRRAVDEDARVRNPLGSNGHQRDDPHGGRTRYSADSC